MRSGPNREDKKLTKVTRRDAVQLGAGAVVGVTLGGVLAPWPAGAPGRDGQAIWYGIRPDHLSVADGGGFGAMVDVVEATGADALVFARAGNQRICGAFAERYNFRLGERIALAPRLDCVHLFDAQSGVNLML